MASEDVENEARAVERLDVDRLFDVALLARRQLLVKEQEVVALGLLELADLVQLALADQRGGIGQPD